MFHPSKRKRMKRTGCLFDRLTDYDNLVDAFHKASKGKTTRRDVRDFAADFDENIIRLRQSIIDDTIEIGNYHFFTIYDPKCRRICAASFPERILHHAIINVCGERFERNLIYDTFATRKGKGTYAAIDRAIRYLKKYPYVVKLDFKKYYDSISHQTLKGKLRRLFKDAGLLHIFDRIIDSYEVSPGRGLPIGNLTSQYFANHYLSAIDHSMREEEKVGGYVRYMDDILMMSTSKSALKSAVKKLGSKSADAGLTIKSPLYANSSSGVNFLGYRLFPHYYVMSSRSKRRYSAKMRLYHELYAEGAWTEADLNRHLVPLTAFALHGSNRSFRKTCNNRVEVV